MSNIPRRVAADAAQADTALAELATALRAAPPEPVTLPPVQPQQPPAPVPPPAANEPPAPQPPQPPQPPQQPTGVPVDLTAELARMNQQIATMAGRVEAERVRREAVEAELRRVRENPPAPAAPPTPPPQLITEKDREDFGADTIDFVERAIRHHTGGLLTTLTDISKRLAGLEGQLGQTATQVQNVAQQSAAQRQAAYFGRLDQVVPTWEALQTNQKFLDWLDKREVLSGAKYGELLGDAHNRADAERVIELFRAYDPAVVTGSPAAPAPSGQPAAQQPLVDPTSLAAPTTSPAAPVAAQPVPGEIWTMAQVDKMYEDKRKGKLSESDFLQLEARYTQALREGRVVAA